MGFGRISSKAEQIRQLNDTFRQSFLDGQITIINETDRLPPTAKLELFDAIKSYDAFTEDNDPYGEHDFGSLSFQGDQYFWKIDCYDKDMLYHSPDPANPKLTMRVLTIMMAEEYSEQNGIKCISLGPFSILRAAASLPMHLKQLLGTDQ